MRAILVSVDYADLLTVTLPYNRQHFEQVFVVTSSADHATQEVAKAHDAEVVVTDLFYARGAAFNKWAALEYGLDVIGREGWLCLMDADVLWPKELRCNRWSFANECCLTVQPMAGAAVFEVKPGQLCSPLRRMCSLHEGMQAVQESNSERWWNRFPIHRNVNEWAGYSQIFHAQDLVLGAPPWHDVSWKHAGGADSFFQAKWAPQNKVRPPFEVLHLGEAGKNWYGRATPRLDGTVHPEAEARAGRSAAIWAARRSRKAQGLDPFEPEKLK